MPGWYQKLTVLVWAANKHFAIFYRFRSRHLANLGSKCIDGRFIKSAVQHSEYREIATKMPQKNAGLWIKTGPRVWLSDVVDFYDMATDKEEEAI